MPACWTTHWLPSHIEGGLGPMNYAWEASTLLCCPAFCCTRARLGKRASSHLIRYMTAQEPVDLLEDHKTKPSGKCRLGHCLSQYLILWSGGRRWNYYHTFVEGYGRPLMEAKMTDIERDMISSYFLIWTSTSRNKWHVWLIKVTLTYTRLPGVMMERVEGFPSTQCLGATALDDLVFMRYDEEATLFLVSVTSAWTFYKNDLYYA